MKGTGMADMKDQYLKNTRAVETSYVKIPVRTLSDKRLSSVDWRVFVAIARFASLGTDGRHCWENQVKIAALAKVEAEIAYRSILRLHEWGYLDIHRDSSTRQYSVIR